MPLLIINLPAYNEEACIERTIDSILNQSFKDFLLIIHDNKSTDRTLEICKRFASLDKRVVLNQGAVNIGGQACKMYFGMDSKYISMRSANDVLDCEYFAETIDILERDKSCSLAYSHGYEFVDNPPDAIPVNDSLKFDTRGMNAFQSCVEVMMKYTTPFALWGVYRRDSFEKSRSPQFVYGGDHIFVAENSLYGAVATTEKRLDWKQSKPIDFHLGMNKRAKHQTEEHARGVPEKSIFFGFKVVLPFTDMAWGHMEMLSMARVADQLKASLIVAAREIFTARFGVFMRNEALNFFHLIQQNSKTLEANAGINNLPLFLWISKAFRECEKIRIMRTAEKDIIKECEKMLFSIKEKIC